MRKRFLNKKNYVTMKYSVLFNYLLQTAYLVVFMTFTLPYFALFLIGFSQFHRLIGSITTVQLWFNFTSLQFIRFLNRFVIFNIDMSILYYIIYESFYLFSTIF